MSGEVLLWWAAILASCALCYLYGRLRGAALAYRDASDLLNDALEETGQSDVPAFRTVLMALDDAGE